MNILLSVASWFTNLLALIPKLVYFISMSIISILDVFQFAIRKLAGLDVHYIGESGQAQTGDIALGFIKGIFDPNSQFPALKNTFWTLVVLGVVMLVLATIIAVIRSEYATADNNKNIIIKNAFKGFAMFLIVPLSVIFGLTFTDLILVGIDKATSATQGRVGGGTYETTEYEITKEQGIYKLIKKEGVATRLVGTEYNGSTTYVYYDIFGGGLPSGSTTFSGSVFKVAAFSANRVRKGEVYENETLFSHFRLNNVTNFGIFDKAETAEEMAVMIDEAFANNVVLNTNQMDTQFNLGVLEDVAGSGLFTLNNGYKVKNFSKFNVALVWAFYDLWQYNYIIAFAFSIILVKIMVNVIVGLMKRMIELIALFMISPPIVALYPLDGGKALGNWRGEFLKRAISAIATITAFNIYFLILPYLQLINFLPNTNIGFKFINMLISTIFVVAGATMVESFIALFSKVIGSDDLNKDNGKFLEGAEKTLKTSMAFVGAAAGVGAGVTARMLGINRGIGGGPNAPGGGGVGNNPLARRALLLGRQQMRDERFGAEQEWLGGRGKEEYINQMQNNEQFSEIARQEYDDDVHAAQMGQSFEDYIANPNQNLLNAYATHSGTSMQDYLTNNQDRYVNEHMHRYTDHVVSDRAHRIAGGYRRGILGRANTLANDTISLTKDATIREGKGGIRAMVGAFQGRTLEDIRRDETNARIERQEAQTRTARDRTRNDDN